MKIEKIENLRKSVLSKDVLEKTDFFQNAKKSILWANGYFPFLFVKKLFIKKFIFT